MKTQSEHARLIRQAQHVAKEYRDLAAELAQAADVLDKATNAALLPVVSITRLAEVMRAGMILHYLSDLA